MNQKLLVLCAFAGAVCTGFPAQITSNTSGDANSNDYDCFRYGQYVKSGKAVLLWSDGNPPSPENDYLIGGGIINTPNYAKPATNFVFQGGSLTLSNGTLGIYTWSPSSVEFPVSIGGLKMKDKADLRSRSSTGGTSIIKGLINVTATFDKPGTIRSTGTGTNMATLQFDAKLTGSSSAFLSIDRYTSTGYPGNTRMALHGDCSEYFGKIRVNGYTNRLRIACAQFPGEVRQVGPSRVEIVGETMAVRFINQTDAKKCDIELSPTSTVTMAKLTLADKGTIYVGGITDTVGVVSCGSIAVTNELAFQTVDAKVTIDAHSIPLPADPIEHPAFCPILKYTEGTLSLDRFTVQLPSSRSSAVIGEKSKKGWGLLPNWRVVVTNYEDAVLGAVSAIAVTTIPVVRRVKGKASSSSVTDGTAWSDGQAPHADADYLIPYQSSTFAPWGGTGTQKGPTGIEFVAATAVFGGRSLTTQCEIDLKTPLVQIDDLTMMGGNNYDGAASRFYGADNASAARDADGRYTHTVSGRVIRIYTSSTTAWGDKAVLFRSAAGRKLTIDSALQGTGNLTIEHPHQEKPKSGGYVFLKCDNSGFTGRLRVSDMDPHKSYTDEPSRDNNITLLVSNENQIGGKMSSFTYNAFILRRWGCVENIGDVTFTATANRGLYVEGHGHVRTPEGTTMAFNQRLTMAGELYKSGKGTLALGAETAPTFTSGQKAYAVAYDGTNVVTVADGGLMATTKVATEGLAVTFTGTGSLAVDPNATGDMATYGYCATAAGCALTTDNADGKIPLSFKWPAGADPEDFTAAVCTVPSGTDLSFKLVGKPYSGARIAKVEERDNGNDTKTYMATVFKSGLMILIK